MKTIGISKAETSIFVEYIQNYINDSMSGFHEIHAKEIDCTVASFKGLSQKVLKRIINLQIVQKYTTFIETLTVDLNNKICEYFDFEQLEKSSLPYNNNLYHYHLNHKLLSQYDRTDKLSELMEKLINKTIDFTFLHEMQTPILTKFIDSLSVGSLFMSSLGLDSSLLRNRHKEELSKMLLGIVKNINIRTNNFLSKQYALLIYQIAQENQDIFCNEQAI